MNAIAAQVDGLPATQRTVFRVMGCMDDAKTLEVIASCALNLSITDVECALSSLRRVGLVEQDRAPSGQALFHLTRYAREAVQQD